MATISKETNSRLAVIEEQINNIQLDTSKICKTLHGNGNVGLKTQVELNEDRLGTLDSTMRSYFANVKWIVLIAIASVTCITGAINLLI